MKFSSLFQSIRTRPIVTVIGGCILALLIFKAGIVVGYHQARFSFRWGENHHEDFGGARGGFFRDMMEGGFRGAHGTVGSITKIQDDRLTIQDEKEKAEKTILVTKDTKITLMRDEKKLSDLKVDDDVIVIGEPNDKGEIEAKFIRIMPEKESTPERGNPSS